MTTYDAIRDRTTVWIRPRRKDKHGREWVPLFWFRGCVSNQDSGRDA